MYTVASISFHPKITVEHVVSKAQNDEQQV